MDLTRKRGFSFHKDRYTKYSIGALFPNHNKMAPEHPDAMGELDVPKVLLGDLLNQFQAHGKAKISIAGWNGVILKSVEF